MSNGLRIKEGIIEVIGSIPVSILAKLYVGINPYVM